MAIRDNELMTVVVVEPGKRPEIQHISDTLEARQNIVGGFIECIYPFAEPNICLVCNEEGKINNLPPNRTVNDDVMAGTFFIAGLTRDGDFRSLTQAEAAAAVMAFEKPEVFPNFQGYDYGFRVTSFDNLEDIKAIPEPVNKLVMIVEPGKKPFTKVIENTEAMEASITGGPIDTIALMLAPGDEATGAILIQGCSDKIGPDLVAKYEDPFLDAEGWQDAKVALSNLRKGKGTLLCSAIDSNGYSRSLNQDDLNLLTKLFEEPERKGPEL